MFSLFHGASICVLNIMKHQHRQKCGNHHFLLASMTKLLHGPKDRLVHKKHYNEMVNTDWYFLLLKV